MIPVHDIRQPTYRYNGADGKGFSKTKTATFRDSDRDGNKSRDRSSSRDQMRGRDREGAWESVRLSVSDEFLRSSLDTLGSTGYKGLLDQSLRLGAVTSTLLFAVIRLDCISNYQSICPMKRRFANFEKISFIHSLFFRNTFHIFILFYIIRR